MKTKNKNLTARYEDYGGRKNFLDELKAQGLSKKDTGKSFVTGSRKK